MWARPWWVCLLLTLAGGVLSALLMIQSFSGGAVPGCDGGSGCSQVLASRWAFFMGEPVSSYALGVYLLTLAMLWLVRPWRIAQPRKLAWQIMLGAGVVIFTIAIWFTILQAFVIGNWCLYCSAAHLCGAVLAGVLWWCSPVPWNQRLWTLAIGKVAALAFILVQIFMPTPTGGQVMQFSKAGNFDQRGGAARTIAVLNGALQLQPGRMPVVGSPDADYLVLEVIDYTCPHCRALHEQMLTVRQTLPDFGAVILVTPLSSQCNSNLTETAPLHTDACAIARLMLAIYFTQPQHFEQAHDLVMSSRVYGIEQIRTLLQTQMSELDLPPQRLPSQLRMPIDAMLEHNVKLQELLGPAMPQVVAGSALLQGRPYDAAQLLEIIRSELPLPPRTSAAGAAVADDTPTPLRPDAAQPTPSR